MIMRSASGQCVNFAKSSMMFSLNFLAYCREFLEGITDIKSMDCLGTYLGLLAIFTRRRSQDFKYIIDRVWKVLQG